jgi:hypothetical protein
MRIKRAWIVFGFGVLAAQAGHLLAYQVRFGPAALQVQSSSVHAYFPGVVRTSLGIAAALALAALFLIGLARILSGRPTIRTDSSPHYARLVAALFTVQLLLFAAQEVGEAVVGGTAVDSVAHLLLWGTLGQLPVALIAAAGLRWLPARFESAVQEIHTALAEVPTPVAYMAVATSAWRHVDPNVVLRPVAGASLAKRGPPSSVRISSH